MKSSVFDDFRSFFLRVNAKMMIKHNGNPPPEERLVMGMAGAVCIPLSQLPRLPILVHSIYRSCRSLLVGFHNLSVRTLDRPHHRSVPVRNRHVLRLHIGVHLPSGGLSTGCGFRHGWKQLHAFELRLCLPLVRRCDVSQARYSGGYCPIGWLNDFDGTVAVSVPGVCSATCLG